MYLIYHLEWGILPGWSTRNIAWYCLEISRLCASSRHIGGTLSMRMLSLWGTMTSEHIWRPLHVVHGVVWFRENLYVVKGAWVSFFLLSRIWMISDGTIVRTSIINKVEYLFEYIVVFYKYFRCFQNSTECSFFQIYFCVGPVWLKCIVQQAELWQVPW